MIQFEVITRAGETKVDAIIKANEELARALNSPSCKIVVADVDNDITYWLVTFDDEV